MGPFISDERIKGRFGIDDPSPPTGDYMRFTGTGKEVEARTPAEVLGDVAKAEHHFTLLATGTEVTY